MGVSVLILTLNEECNLPFCLESLQGFDDIVVLDSLSCDATEDVAKRYGVRFVQRRFDNWSSHQNWALEHIDFKNPWVFYLDADERMTPELRAELLDIAEGETDGHVAYYCGRKNFLMGRWIRHSMPPGYLMRFFQPGNIAFERLVNPVPVVDGSVGYLSHRLLHYNFSKGLGEWIDKHNRYSQMEAQETIAFLDRKRPSLRAVLTRDPARRRQGLKSLSYVLPFRPAIKFFYMYVIKRGFLDGYPGLVYCTLQSIYEYFIFLKEREIRLNRKGIRL